MEKHKKIDTKAIEYHIAGILKALGDNPEREGLIDTPKRVADFKKEALQRKKAVKTGTASPKEFTDWLYQQSDIILKLTTF